MTTDPNSASLPVRPRRAVDSGRWPAPIATEPTHATVRIPGSKSETNRALVLAALADGPSRIVGGLDARDTQLMRAGLRQLGVGIAETKEIEETKEGEETREGWVVTPPAPLAAQAATIECGLAGTVMRFLPALAALGPGPIDFVGDPQAEARPMGPVLDGLYDMGATVTPGTTTLPFTVGGRTDLPGGSIRVDASTSSQFLSALLLIGARCQRGLSIESIGPTLPSRPHIDMTVAMLRERGVRVDDSRHVQWRIEPGPVLAKDTFIAPDLSNAAPFLAAAVITGGEITVPDWPTDTNQPGDRIREILVQFGASAALRDGGLTVSGNGVLHGVDLDLSDVSELTPVVAALAAVARESSRLRGVGHIRGHETDRLAALEAELNGLGSHVRQTEDGLTIHPRVLHGGEWRTYADHRMAHAGALLGLLVDGVTVDDIGCTSKTMPEFPLLWTQMLADSDDWSDRRIAAERAMGDGATG